jgi:SAM-dependent methyltransferase
MSNRFEVVGYDYDAERDRRWRDIVANFGVLDEDNEADAVVPRLLARRCNRVLEIGSHWGPVAERFVAAGGQAVCLELNPEIARLAHRPVVQGSAALLPFADGSFDAVTALNVLYFLERPEVGVAEASRVLRPGGVFVACTQARDNDPELRDVAPGWGEATTFDGENAEAVVRRVFEDLDVERWDVVAYRLPTHADVVDYVEVFYKLPRAEAERRAGAVDGPLEITKRGLFVWAVKD